MQPVSDLQIFYLQKTGSWLTKSSAILDQAAPIRKSLLTRLAPSAFTSPTLGTLLAILLAALWHSKLRNPSPNPEHLITVARESRLR